ncbi:hypothetical protein PTSG_03045 [Salpingoeca rosetta]|uniref:Uncharacterized protein n=1 Tax=Salpingoeca rosetta (strain ATCC 50818 / BSB-021) TaxID=946362 RepID=F2U436_SALR5|nr:uncharacterized protein PTSG_03045 [Salpingoeca rosetta]EGD82402.1 hypothetical protein PTSG_03045 [Salpingoeca rosetta]|eukprot:XP_004995638.1 hypothetical protein PTSG_03045 [Salpingoeca rosetta]
MLLLGRLVAFAPPAAAAAAVLSLSSAPLVVQPHEQQHQQHMGSNETENSTLVVIGGCLGREGDPNSDAVYALELGGSHANLVDQGGQAHEHDGYDAKIQERGGPHWQSLPSLPVAVRGAAATVRPRSQQIIVTGGSTPDGRCTNQVLVLHKERWSDVATLPVSTSCHTCMAVDDDTIVCCGGWDGAECLSTTQLVSLVSMQSSHSDNLMDARKNAGLVQLASSSNAAALLVGGWNGQRTLRSTEIVTVGPTAQQSTSTLGPLLNTPRECAAVATQGPSHGVCVGGYNEDDVLLRSCEEMMLDTNGTGEWTETAWSFPAAPRENSACAATPTHVFVAGGWDGHRALRDVWVLTRATGQWHQLPPLPVGLNRACAVVVPTSTLCTRDVPVGT